MSSKLTELRRRAGLEVFLNGIPFERALLKVAAEHPELVNGNTPKLAVVAKDKAKKEQ